MMTPYKYYSPVTDVTFRKVFGENIDLAASLLNAFLPLPEGRKITNIKYVPYKQMPNTPTKNYNYVNVNCTDSKGSIFSVEIQLNWDTDFLRQLEFDSSKVYVKQLDKGKPFQLLQPVYSLNFVQGDLHKGLSEWYHPYQLVHIYHTNRVFNGLKIVFAELEKYEKFAEKGDTKMDLWMRYFTEMTEKTRKPAPELLADPDIAKAIELLEVINYDDVERELYDRYWDAVSVEATWKEIGRRAKKEGFEVGREQGIQQGIQQGEANTKRQLAINMLAKGLDQRVVAEITGMPETEIRALGSPNNS